MGTPDYSFLDLHLNRPSKTQANFFSLSLSTQVALCKQVQFPAEIGPILKRLPVVTVSLSLGV